MSNFYSSTADGQVYHGVTSDPPTQEDWDSCHDAEVGTEVFPDGESGLIGRGSHTDSWTDLFTINRSFFYFDTTGAPLPTTVELWVYIIAALNESLVVMEGTQADSLTTADFNAFTGLEFGHLLREEITEGAWHKVIFNSLGRSKINRTGVTKICVRQYEHDYLDLMPEDKVEHYQTGYYTENATYKPYLLIQTGISDIGIRVRTAGGTIKIGAEPLDGHKLRIRKGDTTYGIPLLATNDANASPVRIYDGANVKSLPEVD